MGEEKRTADRRRAAADSAEPATGAADRPVRIAEALSPTRAPEFAEWDMYTPRKPYAAGSHALLARNDRTPLNTPYTPQLVKLHLTRHDEYEGGGEPAQGLFGRALASIRAKIDVLARPVRKIRGVVDNTVTWLVPGFLERSSLFQRVRPWVVSYVTAAICVPIVWLCSPMLIALSIFTAPVWSAGLAALAIRQLVPANSHQRISAEYAHSSDLSTTTEDDHDEMSPSFLSSAYRQADYNGSRLVG